AIVDDIGGILVIAIFYSSDIALPPLMLTAGTIGLVLVLRQVGVWYLPVYVVLGIIAWAATVESGIHPTIIGVILGLLTPWRPWYHEEGFAELAREEMTRFEEAAHAEDEGAAQEQQHALRQLDVLTD